MRILVADDDPEIRAAIRTVLRGAGFDVSEAADGVAALRSFRSEQPDLVLCDVFMPIKDGLETIADLRRHSLTVKIVAMSGGGTVWTKSLSVTATQLGAAAVLLKPFTGLELLRVIQQALEGG